MTHKTGKVTDHMMVGGRYCKGKITLIGGTEGHSCKLPGKTIWVGCRNREL